MGIGTHSLDMVLQDTRYCFGMFDILLCDQCQIRDGVSVVGDEVIKRVSIILRNLIGWYCRHDWEDCSEHSQKRKETTAGSSQNEAIRQHLKAAHTGSREILVVIDERG